jgi:WD40 repeat protein
MRHVHRDDSSFRSLWAAATLCVLFPHPIRAAEPRQFDHSRAVHAVAFVEGGTTLASLGNDGSVKFWDLATDKEKATWKGSARWTFAVAFSPNSKVMVTAFADEGEDEGKVKYWDIATQKELAVGVAASGKGSRRVVRALGFSPDGKILATGSWDKTVRLWDVATGQEQVRWTAPGEVLSLAFAPDGKTLAAGTTERAIQIWRVSDGKELAILRTKAYRIVALSFHPDGQVLLSGNANDLGHRAELGPGEIQVWDVATGNPSLTWDHPDQVRTAAFSPSGGLIATAGEVGVVRLWDSSGKPLEVLKGHTKNIACLAFHPDGKSLATGAEDGKVMVWDLQR